MKKFFIIILLLLLSNVVFAAKIATIYSAYANNMFEESMKNDIIAAGYEFHNYLNTDLDKLVSEINDYDMVITASVYNYVNTVDFSQYKNELYSYVENGGVLIITDVNYPTCYEWIPKVFPGLYFVSGEVEALPEGGPATIYGRNHPIIKGVPELFLPWCSASKVSPEFNVLTLDKRFMPVTVYKEIGKGLLIVSTSYFQNGFPSGLVINNIGNYMKSPREKEVHGADVYVSTKPSKVNKLRKVYGIDSETEWTVNKNNNGLHFNFVCYDKDIINCVNTKFKRDDIAYNDDSIDIFIKPNDGENNNYYFSITENNIIYDAKNFDKSYSAYIESKVKLEDDKWILDVFIPYSSIGITKDSKIDKKAPLLFSVSRNYHPNKYKASLYVWGDRMVANSDLWGKLVFDTPIKTSVYTFKGTLELTCPEKVLTNDNIFTINNNLNFKIYDLTDKKSFEGKSGKCVVNFDNDGNHDLMAVISDKTGNILVSSKVYTVKVIDLLNVKTLYPYYRDIVQSKDLDKNMDLLCSVTEYNGENYSIKYTIKSKDSLLKEDTFTYKEPIHINYDLSKLSVGTYSYTVSLIKDNKVLRTKSRDFEVLPPSDYEVTFDKKKICYINGEPFFPIGLYHSGAPAVSWLNKNKKEGVKEVTVEDLNKEVGEAGFNLVMTQDYHWPMEEKTVNMAKENGTIYNFELGPVLEKEKLSKLTEAYNKYSTGLFYYTVDEPINDKLDKAIVMYNELKRIDPHRPCGAAVCFPQVFYDAVKAFDIMMPDTYLFVNYKTPSIAELLGPIEIAKDACGDQKPLWAVPQLFGWGGEKPGFTVPSPEDVRAQMYFYLVHGATGFCWYGYTSPEKDKTAPYGMWHLPTSGLWEPIKVLNEEMKEFAPVIIKGDSVGPLKCNNEKIHSNVWKCEGKNYAIIVNPERENFSVTFEELKGEIKPFFDKDKYNFNNGSIELKPLECVIIVF